MSVEEDNYYIVFCDSEIKSIQWLKPGFRHCYIMRNEFDSVWTVIQHSREALEVKTFLKEDYPHPRDFAAKGATILKVKKRVCERGRGHFCHFNCVEVAKAVLGIRMPFVLTPYQLYRYLYGSRRNNPARDRERQGQAKEGGEASRAGDSATEAEAIS